MWPLYSRTTAPTLDVRYRVLSPLVLPRDEIQCGAGSGPLGCWRGVLAVSLVYREAVRGQRLWGRTGSRRGHTARPWGTGDPPSQGHSLLSLHCCQDFFFVIL